MLEPGKWILEFAACQGSSPVTVGFSSTAPDSHSLDVGAEGRLEPGSWNLEARPQLELGQCLPGIPWTKADEGQGRASACFGQKAMWHTM